MQRVSLLCAFELTLAQIAVALSIISAKILVTEFPIFLLLGLRFLISACILFTLNHLILKTPSNIRAVSRKDWGIFFLQAMCAGFLFNILMVNGVRYTTATEAGIIGSTLPAIIALMSYFLLKEKLAKHKWFAILLAIAGIVLINLNKANDISHSISLLGNMLVLLALIPEGFFTILAKWHKTTFSPMKVAQFVVFINALTLLPVVLYLLPQFSFAKLELWHIGLLLCYGLFDSLFYIFWSKGVRRVPANMAALFTAVMPIAATFFAWLFLNELMDTLDIIGMALVLFSILLGSGYLWKTKNVKF